MQLHRPVNNGINLAFLAQAPATANQSPQAAQQGSPAGNQLFANMLMQKMSPTAAMTDFNNGDQPSLDFSTNGLSPNDFSGLPANSTLASLISAIKQQLGKSNVSPSFGVAGANDSNASDPMLAVWLASLAALQQQQPKPQDSGSGVQVDPTAKLLAGIQSQLGGSAPDPRVLKALEQALSQLSGQAANPAKTNSSDTETTDKFAIPTSPSAPSIATAPLTPAATATATPAVSSTVRTEAPAVKTDGSAVQQPLAAELSKIATSSSVNAATKVDLPKPDGKVQSLAPTVNAPANADRSPQVQPAVAPAVGDAKSDNQNQTSQGASQEPSDSRSSGDSRKNAQPDLTSEKFTVQSVSGGASATVEQNPGVTGFQPVARNVIVDQSHNSPAPATSPATAVREAMHIDPTEAPAAPRSVNQASLMQAASQAEMRVSIKTESAGTMDVRAVLEGNHISATIAAQHGATRDWLVANVHDLNQSLSRDDLKLRTFEVKDSSLQNEPQRGATSDHEQPDAQKPRQYFQNRKDPVFTDNFKSEDVETGISGTPKRALSLLA